MEELKDNQTHVLFECHDTNGNCVYFKKDKDSSFCSYMRGSYCFSIVAMVNRMVLELKHMGIKIASGVEDEK